jgi:hypothetical protein
MSHDDSNELEGSIHEIFNPEPVVGSEGTEYYETPPFSRLSKEYGLDTSYWRPFEYGSTSPLVRRALDDDHELAAIVQAQQVPRELFMGTFRLFGDSILGYHRQQQRTGPYRFYPGILASAWAAFEAFVRIYSELLVKTAPFLPTPVRLFLIEKEEHVERRGTIRRVAKGRPLLDRYWIFLKYGYGVEYDRGGRIWQMGESALDKRHELIHYKHSEMPAIKSTELWQHLESILLLILGPSSSVNKTIMPDVYDLYGVLCQLGDFIEDYEERPNFKDYPIDLSSVIFPCPFHGVDEVRFPTMHSSLRREG